MPPTPTATLSPLNPFSSLYGHPNEHSIHYMFLRCYGVWYDAWSERRLIDQSTQDKAVMYSMAMPSPPPTAIIPTSFKNSRINMGFSTNATPENQYLLIYHLKGREGARAAFYINGNLIRSEEIDGEEYVAILVDCPPPQTFWHADMFHEERGMLEFMGIELYIL
ncbi:hypothetical protein ACFLRN_02765 [Thermoproteota archaeon]